MKYRVLGPVEMLTTDGKQVAVGSDRQSALVAALMARRGQVVSTDQLVDLLWGDDAPKNPANAVQVLVSRLRSAVRKEGGELTELETKGTGYALMVADGDTDAGVFEDLVARGGAAAPATAIDLLREALGLWRGRAFGEHGDTDVARLEALRLDEVLRSATVSLGAALAGAGRPDEAVAVLEPLTVEHPLDERAKAELMRALYAQGRHADALQIYQDYRGVLAEELGLEPSAALRQLEVEILRHELPDAARPQPSTQPSLADLAIRHLPYDGGSLAWAKVGTGPRLAAVPAWVTSLDVMASGRDPRSSILDRLTDHTELILYDRRGTGLSGGDVGDFSVEAGSRELEAVLEASGGAATLLAMSQAGPAAITLAIRRPDLVPALILFGTFASGPETFGNSKLAAAILEVVRSHWGVGSRLLAGLYRPDASDAAAEHLGRVLQDSAPRDVAAGYLETVYTSDVTELLPQIACPTLVIHYSNDRVIPFVGAKQLAGSIPDAQLRPLEGPYHLPDAADLDRAVSAIVDFLATV